MRINLKVLRDHLSKAASVYEPIVGGSQNYGGNIHGMLPQQGGDDPEEIQMIRRIFGLPLRRRLHYY